MKVFKFILSIIVALILLLILWDKQLDDIPKINTYFVFWVIVISINLFVHVSVIYWLSLMYYFIFKCDD